MKKFLFWFFDDENLDNRNYLVSTLFLSYSFTVFGWKLFVFNYPIFGIMLFLFSIILWKKHICQIIQMCKEFKKKEKVVINGEENA